MFKIELFLETRLVREYYFDKKLSITIGRHPSHDIRLDYLGVSGDHAKIHFFPSLLLEDMGSKNGTALNGEFIKRTAPLKHGDVIGITKYGLRFLDEQIARMESGDDCATEAIPSTWIISPPGEGKAITEAGEATISEADMGTKMTPREFECLYWLSRGKTTAEISPLLKISERTVNFHITNICEKLGAANRTQAIAKAFSLKLIDPGESR